MYLAAEGTSHDLVPMPGLQRTLLAGAMRLGFEAWSERATPGVRTVCNLYSITTNQAAIAAPFRVMNRYVGNLPPMTGVFPDCPAPVVRNDQGGRELVTLRHAALYITKPPKAEHDAEEWLHADGHSARCNRLTQPLRRDL